MSGSLPMAVDGRNLTHRYGQFTAVDDVTLQVRPGETMGLLGPNGAGKTTVVRMLTTLTPVQHGELRIFGLDARDQTVDIRSNIGYVPQQLSIEPALTGRQNVAWFARLYGVPAASGQSGWTRPSTRWSCSTSPTGWQAPTPAGWCVAWKWRRRW